MRRQDIMRFAPEAKPELVDAILEGWPLAVEAGIDESPRRLHLFMASIATETMGLQRVEENLNYTTVKRLRAIFGKYIKSDAAAQNYIRQPKKLAILVYGGRLGNAPAPSTDGWDFRGGGMMQTTGRANYRDVGFEHRPELLRVPSVAFATAVAEWKKRRCNMIADNGTNEDLRRAINGGLNGMADFRQWLSKAGAVWPTYTAPPMQPWPTPMPTPVPPPPAPPAPLPQEPASIRGVVGLVVMAMLAVGGAVAGLVAGGWQWITNLLGF